MTYFFFQAEDGIRDYKVTGVQTCALPIYHPSRRCCLMTAVSLPVEQENSAATPAAPSSHILGTYERAPMEFVRSEERRVGKECGHDWWMYQRRKKQLMRAKHLKNKISRYL